MQRKHCGPEEATWEMEDAMQLAHPFCSILHSTKGDSSVAIVNFSKAPRKVLLKGEGNVTPRF